MIEAQVIIPEPRFWNVKPIRQITENLGSTLLDLESRMAPGHPYRDRDVINWAHELTHGLNSVLRKQGINAAYLLQGRVMLFKEPRLSLQQVVDSIPSSLRGMNYPVLRGMIQVFPERPLYIIDEWTAYTNGTLSGIDYRYMRPESHKQMLEFCGYAWHLMTLVSGESFTNFVRWNTQRVLKIAERLQINQDLLKQIKVLYGLP